MQRKWGVESRKWKVTSAVCTFHFPLTTFHSNYCFTSFLACAFPFWVITTK